MPRIKTIEESGQTLALETERIQKEPIKISHTEAKKLMKREMTEKQSEHIKKLVEANRLKYEQKRKDKEQALKKHVEEQVLQEQKKREEKKVVDVVVEPKRQYKPRHLEQPSLSVKPPKKKIIIEESETDSDSEEEVVYIKKPKNINKVINNDFDAINKKIETVKQIDHLIQQTGVNKYSSMIRF